MKPNKMRLCGLLKEDPLRKTILVRNMVNIAPSIAGGMISGTSPHCERTTTRSKVNRRINHALAVLILMLIPSGSPISSVLTETLPTSRIALSVNKLPVLPAPEL
jgi:hypothetical protein